MFTLSYTENGAPRRHRCCQLNDASPLLSSRPCTLARLTGARHRIPFGERARAEEAVVSGSQQVTADAEQVLDRAVDGREALELPCGLEAAHLPFALSRRFVRDLGSAVGVRVRAVDDRGHHRAAGGSIAGQLVRDQPSRSTALSL